MVFAVAALLFQLSPVPKVVGPVFRANLTTLIATDTADGTRPKPASAVALATRQTRWRRRPARDI